jgi:hypothetical protein
MFSFAIRFLIKGKLDMELASQLFIYTAAIALVITAFLIWRKHNLNPILLGANIWLITGGVAFAIPIPSLAALISELQVSGVFIFTIIVGRYLTSASNRGYIGISHSDPALVRKLSYLLLTLNSVVLAWSLIFRFNFRIGGGMPFFFLNVGRKIMIHYGSKSMAINRNI